MLDEIHAVADTSPLTKISINAHMEAFNVKKDPYISDKPLPLPVARALKKLGHDLALARRRRRFTQASMAERLQTSVATLRRLEKGDSRVNVGLIAQALFVLGELERINGLLDTANDEIGLSLMNEQLPQRIRNKSQKPPTGAL